MERKNLIEFFTEVMKLKKVKRSGWIVSGVKDVESVADHSFMTTLMTLILGKNRNIDLNKALKMAIIHDIAECKIGDIITWKNYHKPEKEKKEMEEKEMTELLSSLGPEGKEYLDIWEEYEKMETPESKFVQSIDKFEMVLQALEYEKVEKNLNKLFETFFEDGAEGIIDKDVLEMFNLILSLRKNKFE